jgi:hypothetical protein
MSEMKRRPIYIFWTIETTNGPWPPNGSCVGSAVEARVTLWKAQQQVIATQTVKAYKLPRESEKWITRLKLDGLTKSTRRSLQGQ